MAYPTQTVGITYSQEALILANSMVNETRKWIGEKIGSMGEHRHDMALEVLSVMPDFNQPPPLPILTSNEMEEEDQQPERVRPSTTMASPTTASAIMSGAYTTCTKGQSSYPWRFSN
ncbi:uncharacterized protein LOC119735927 [Patiria miniata]|uniref:Uncharacterized protein n=1 Tax=Patiria miniata TaxID=46514 RepID=A0A914AQU5_PATMI|nr:uncharacterized protein LOC119735927 [Patiria miniata]